MCTWCGIFSRLAYTYDMCSEHDHRGDQQFQKIKYNMQFIQILVKGVWLMWCAMLIYPIIHIILYCTILVLYLVQVDAELVLLFI